MYELSTDGQQNLLDIIHGEGANLPKNPFEEEIRLTTFMLAGTLYGEQLRGLAIKLRQGAEVRFFREPDNEEMAYAIRAEAAGMVIGYVPETISEIPANLLDAGKLIYGKINRCVIGYAGADIIVDMFIRF